MKLFFAVILTVFSLTCHAQFNDSISHYVYMGSTGSFTKTNDLNSFVLNNAVKYTLSKKNVSFHTANAWIYGEQSDVKINNDFSSLVEFDFLKNKNRLYYWGITTFDKSYSLKIDHRFQGGGGVGLNIFNTPKLVIIVTNGFIYELGKLRDNYIGDRDYDLWRNSARIKYRWVMADVVILDGSGFIQPSVTTRHDTIIRSTTTLSFKVKKWLSITSSLTYNKITLTGRENLVATYGIVLERFF